MYYLCICINNVQTLNIFNVYTREVFFDIFLYPGHHVASRTKKRDTLRLYQEIEHGNVRESGDNNNPYTQL